jgi:hypothetical protein
MSASSHILKKIGGLRAFLKVRDEILGGLMGPGDSPTIAEFWALKASPVEPEVLVLCYRLMVVCGDLVLDQDDLDPAHTRYRRAYN